MTDHPIAPPADTERIVADVIDLAGVRIRWGRSTAKYKETCEHLRLTYSQTESRVWCDDCSRTIENFAAFMTVVKKFQEMMADVRNKTHTANEAMKATITKRGTKAIDRAWSGQVMAVACPHCRGGLLPEDFANGVAPMTSREIELARRARIKPT